MSTFWMYMVSFLLGFVGSFSYFLALTLYGRFGKFKTTGGKVKKAKIFGLCIIGGGVAALLETTISENFAPVHALLIGAGWIVFLGPIRGFFYQLQQERRNYTWFVEQSLISSSIKKVESMRVKDFMKKDVNKVSSNTPIDDLWTKLKEHESRLVVVEEPKSPRKTVGIISKRDIVNFVVEQKSLEKITADKIMNRNFIRTKEDETLDKIIAKMDKQRLDRVIVLNKDGVATGWVTREGLRRVILRELRPRTT